MKHTVFRVHENPEYLNVIVRATAADTLSADQLLTVRQLKTIGAIEGVNVYDVTIAGGITHGAISADRTAALEGTKVTVTVSADTGYKLGKLAYNSTEITSPYSFNMPAQDVTLSATFTEIIYPITYDLKGGSVSPANPATYTIESPDFTLTNPTRVGYTFTGWTGTGLDAATKTVTVERGSTGDRKYTANYEILSAPVLSESQPFRH